MVKLFASLGIIGIVLLVLVLIVFGPFVTIWSINTLFATAIPTTFSTWLAAVWLQMVTFGGVQSALRKTK